MKIIALQGRANSGKTRTIHMLHSILLNNGYCQVPGARKIFGADFLDVYLSPKNEKIGVTSSGDTHDSVNDRLQDLISQKCIICVCACRTYDRLPPGTVAATQNFPNYTPQYISKTISKTASQEQRDNINDANRIYQTF